MASAQALFQKMYEQTQGAAGAAGAGPDMGGAGFNSAQGAGPADDVAAGAGAGAAQDNSGDDVVDGDYREV